MFQTSDDAEKLDPADPSQDRRARHLRALEAMSERGLKLTAAVETLTDAITQAAGSETLDLPTAAKALAHLSLAFDRVCRVVRRSMALEEKIADGKLAAEIKAAEARKARHAQRQIESWDNQDLVEDAIRKAVPNLDRERAERLFDDLEDWFETLGDEALTTRSIGELVERACKTLNVPFDPDLWSDETWALEEHASHTPGSPYAWHRRKTPRTRPFDPGAP